MVSGLALLVQGRHLAEPPGRRKEPDHAYEGRQDRVPGFSAEERAAMKARAAERRAEGRKGAKKAEGLQAVLDRIAEMAPDDRALAERVHATVTATAPDLMPRTWYGMPAYANEDGKVVLFF